jgi:hypothetical protein
MNKNEDIQINRFQLNVLLDEERMHLFNYLLENGVYCVKCEDNCQEGVEVNEIFLTRLNDIKVRGTCKKCGGEVARIMEFGEDREFYKQADHFRESIS